MISSNAVRRAEYIIDKSGIVDRTAQMLRTSTRGRPTNTANLRLLFIGLLLSIQTRGTATFTSAAEVLAKDIAFDDQIRLGVRYLNADDEFETILRDDFYGLTKKITDRLNYGTSMEDLTDDERERRHAAVQDICDAVMDVFEFGWPSHMFALDATGLRSWRRSTNASKGEVADAFAVDLAEPDNPDASDEELDLDIDEADDDDSGPIIIEGSRTKSDGARGYKAPKFGSKEIFFGFHEHTLVQVPEIGQTIDDQPPLIRRFEITPANQDARAVSFSLLNRSPRRVTDVIVDRLYSNFKYETWQAELEQLEISQHLDLRDDDHGFTDSDRMRWVAGNAYCPATPDALGHILRPGPTEPSEKHAEFRRQIATRSHYKMVVHTKLNVRGNERLRCPALGGSVGCPLRPGTIQAALRQGLPIIERPPNAAHDGEPLPACCTQSTVQVKPPVRALKHRQPHEWGTKEWEATFARRTYVEGSYGNRKNPSTENVRRGHLRVSGIAWVHLAMALVNASYNLRIIRNWHDRTRRGDPNHPLLTPDHEPFAYMAITEEQARRLLARGNGHAA